MISLQTVWNGRRGRVGRRVLLYLLYIFMIDSIISLLLFYFFIIHMISSPVSSWYNLYNDRGDRIQIITEDFIYTYSPTIINFEEYTHTFSKSILRIDGGSFVIGAKWRGSDVLAVQIGLGPGGKISTLVRQVGPIHIDYYFIKSGEPAPAPDVPPFEETCPPPYPNPFWNCRGETKGLVGLTNGWLAK